MRDVQRLWESLQTMALTLRRAQTFVKLGNLDSRDDFDVMDGPRRIGRVFRIDEGSPPWRWSLSSSIAAEPSQGRAATRATALEALAQSYEGSHHRSATVSRHEIEQFEKLLAQRLQEGR